MPLAIVLAATLLGVLAHVDVGGRTFTVSASDLVAVAVAIAGGVAAWRRGYLRVDRALAAYAALLGVLALQVALLTQPLDTLGGSSRFFGAALLVVGLWQLAPDHERAEPAWQWPLAIAAFGAALGAWTLALAARALLTGDATSFYAVKNAVTMPLGASNYLATFLVFTTLVSGAMIARDRRFLTPTVVSGLGLLATMSRGAVLATIVVLAAWTIVRRTHRASVVVGVGIAVALGAMITAVSVHRAIGQAIVANQDPSAAAEVDGTNTFGERLASSLGGDVSGRLFLYGTAWATFLDHPVLGVGLNQLPTVTTIAPGVKGHDNAHNLVLHALATVGLLGTLAYAALYLALGRRLRAMPIGPERTALVLGASGLILHAMVEAVAFTRAFEAVLAVALVVTGTYTRELALVEVPLRRRVTVPSASVDDVVPASTASAA